jgi:gliding motility-associated-like protein
MDKFFKKVWSLCLFCWAFSNVTAQILVYPADVAPYSPNNIISNVFLGDGVQILNVEYGGDRGSVGVFDNAEQYIGLERGIVMSTGFVDSVGIVNNDEATTGTIPNDISDNDLQNIAGTVPVTDVSKYEITFIPFSDTLEFRYVFASDEYPEFVCADFNDLFGFFITGPNPEGGNYNAENIALIPDPADPSGSTFLDLPVTINNVNTGIQGESNTTDPINCAPPFGTLDYAQYYNTVPQNEYPTFDGYLNVFSARAVVTPCETYTIKIAIGDAGDDAIDSGVFLEAKSFGTGTISVNFNAASLDGSLAEGCSTGELRFSIPNAQDIDVDLDFNLIDTPIFPDMAEEGVDYVTWPDQITIPAGQTSVSIEVDVIADNIEEGDEFIYLDVFKNICFRDTIAIPIRDNLLQLIQLPEDTIICEGDNLNIAALLPLNFEIPSTPFFRNNTIIDIEEKEIEYKSTINVNGVVPDRMNINAFKSICIDTFIGRNLDDYDFYLVAPNGRILELSTDNGFKNLNAIDLDTMLNTCFTVDATEKINNGDVVNGPIFISIPTYTGDFSPEGRWQNIFNSGTPNGNWDLVVVADEEILDTDIPLGFSQLRGWSLEFQPSYTVSFEWYENGSLIDCPDCQSIDVEPTEQTTYSLELNDSYGCNLGDEIIVSIAPPIAAPSNLQCEPGFNNILFSWIASPDATSYEVQIDNSGVWIDIGNLTMYDVTMLDFLQDVNFAVRAIQGNCSSEFLQLECKSLSCPGPIAQSLDVDGTSCYEAEDGRIAITGSGGSGGPYMYELDGEINSTGVFENLVGGDYTVIITDNVGCPAPIDIEIVRPDLIGLLIQKTDISCYNLNDGSIELSASGDFPPLEFAWNIGGNESVKTDLAEGWYVVSTTDANDCERVDSIFINNQDEFILTEITKEDAECFDTETGSATVIFTGGLAPYEIMWSDMQSTETAINLAAGMYTVTITDDNDCELEGSIVIDEPNELQITTSGNMLDCYFDTDGVAKVSGSGGTSPYTYEWEDETTEDCLTGVTAGDYSVTLTDNKGCMIAAIASVTAPDSIPIVFVKEDLTCFESNDGKIEIILDPAFGNQIVTWDDGPTGTVRENLERGTYCMTVTDENDCTNTRCILVNQPSEISTNSVITKTSCQGRLDGAIALTVNGGNGNYMYSWSGPNFTSDEQDIVDIGEGTYELIITDEKDCEAAFSFQVGSQPGMQIDVSITDVICAADTTGSIAISVIGGTEPYSYDWQGPDGYSSVMQNIDNLAAGPYELVVTDDRSCELDSIITVEENDFISLEITGLTALECKGIPTGNARVEATGGVGPYTYLWSDGTMEQSTVTLLGGSQSVTITDSQNCTSEISFSVEEPETAVTATAVGDIPSCAGSKDGTISVEAMGGFPPYLYSIDGIDFTTDPLLLGVASGNYNVEVRDLKGCSFIVENVFVPEVDEFRVNLGDDLLVEYGGAVQLNPFVGGNTFDLMYEWTVMDEDQIDCLDCPMVTISNITEQIIIKVEVSNGLGCFAEDVVTIRPERNIVIKVPTGFSPNGDGQNDILSVFGSEEMQINSFIVFSRWGDKVYETRAIEINDNTQGWDGRVDNKLLQPGVYAWIVEAQYLDGTVTIFKGMTNLIR